MTEPSGYVLEPLREAPDFTLYRGRWHGNPSPVLAVALAAERPSPQSLRRLEHEYSLAAELDPGWAAKPMAFTHHEGRTVLILKDPSGELLDWILERDHGQPLDYVGTLVADAMHCEPGRARPFSATGAGEDRRKSVLSRPSQPRAL